MKKYYYVSYQFVSNSNIGFGGITFQISKGNLSLRNAKNIIDKKNNFQCCIMGFFRITKTQFEEFNNPKNEVEKCEQ